MNQGCESGASPEWHRQTRGSAGSEDAAMRPLAVPGPCCCRKAAGGHHSWGGPEKKQQLSFFPSLSSLLASEQCCWREERSWERLSQPLCALCFHFETHLLQPSCWHRMRPLSSPSSPSVVTGGGRWVLTGAAQPYPVPFWTGITQPAASSRVLPAASPLCRAHEGFMCLHLPIFVQDLFLRQAVNYPELTPRFPWLCLPVQEPKPLKDLQEAVG